MNKPIRVQYANLQVKYKDLTDITNATDISFNFLKIIFMAFCLGEGQKIRRKREWDGICHRFMDWFTLSTSHWHGMHLRQRGKQYVPDSYNLTDGVNHPLWKKHILQLAWLHNDGISNHVHRVHTWVWNYISKSQITPVNT